MVAAPSSPTAATPAQLIVDFMRHGWNLPIPELIISVTGGARFYKITTPELRTEFQDGLISAALTTDLILKLRAEIERQASAISSQGQPHHIPVIQILAEGGPSSVKTVCEALNQNTYLIVIEETGRAADLIAKEYKTIYESPGETSEQEIARKYADFMARYTKGTEDQIINETNREQFIDIMKPSIAQFHISTFKFGNKKEKLNDAILNAIMKATKSKAGNTKESKRTEDLKLAMTWKKFDWVNKILEEKRIGVRFGHGLDLSLLTALRLASVVFIEKLTENGASLYHLKKLMKIRGLYEHSQTILPPPKINKRERNEFEPHLSAVPALFKNSIVKQFEYYYTYLNKNASKTVFSSKVERQTDLEYIYGILDDTENALLDYSNKVIFNSVDMILRDGYLNSISINFHGEPVSHNPEIWIYILTATANPNDYIITFRHQIPPSDIKPSTGIQNFNLSSSAIFITNGQFIALHFGVQTGFVYNTKGRNQYSTIQREKSSKTKTTLTLENQSKLGIAFSFSISPPSGLLEEREVGLKEQNPVMDISTEDVQLSDSTTILYVRVTVPLQIA
ncbi:unnamed protein product [Didymodactylos carnosus]|uniref:TRPM SLOG domain-containing protein n=1 Tax=Didymodactylos carnosus TaxID=1234261 RepID=A0A814BDM8_9BILA|nr:unnamed protein product [Didymodactylos carnosus]CAF0925477.1 unnamed protein product [Didymodactylos carnosus]CAF3686913.1 unnamed protein product [Didymodactylos carnosus]CAF3704167.1 unnamed protein product [Didymodactylos carnosus]